MYSFFAFAFKVRKKCYYDPMNINMVIKFCFFYIPIDNFHKQIFMGNNSTFCKL